MESKRHAARNRGEGKKPDDNLEARLDDIQEKQFGSVHLIRVTQYAALFRGDSVARSPCAADWKLSWSHSIHVKLRDRSETSLIAMLRGEALDPGGAPIFGRSAILAGGLLPLLSMAETCRNDERFESLIFKAFELASGRSLAGRRASPLRMLRLKRLIEQEYQNDLTLKRMAQIVGLSPFVCLRKFKEATGTTPHAYLLDCRIQKARALLCEDCVNIAAVARATGFSDHAHFARIFKKTTGLTPMQYRRIANGLE